MTRQPTASDYLWWLSFDGGDPDDTYTVDFDAPHCAGSYQRCRGDRAVAVSRLDAGRAGGAILHLYPDRGPRYTIPRRPGEPHVWYAYEDPAREYWRGQGDPGMPCSEAEAAEALRVAGYPVERLYEPTADPGWTAAAFDDAAQPRRDAPPTD